MGLRKLSVMALAALAALSTSAWAETKPPVTWRPAAWDNYTASSLGRGIYYVVIHTIEGSAGGAISWFQNSSSNVSAHYVVSYGGTIYQCVADKDIAWHAGNWYYNQHSIGIEHEGYAWRNYWTDAEYRASAAITRWVCLNYGIPMDRAHVIGHNEVPYATHTDPGPYFNWSYYMSLVRGGSTPPPPSTSGTRALRVTANSLNVRTGPGTGYSIKGGISNGQHYVSDTSSNGWYRIWYDGTQGWVSGSYVSVATGVSGVKVTADALNVRTGPGTGYSIVGQVHNGQIYFWTQYEGLNGWYKIYWRGGSYYVHGSYVTRVPL